MDGALCNGGEAMNIKWMSSFELLFSLAALAWSQTPAPVSWQAAAKTQTGKSNLAPLVQYKDGGPAAPREAPLPGSVPLLEPGQRPDPKSLDRLRTERLKASELAMKYRYNMPIKVPDPNIDYKIQIVRPNPKVDYKIQQLSPDGRSFNPSEKPGMKLPQKDTKQSLDAAIKKQREQGS